MTTTNNTSSALTGQIAIGLAAGCAAAAITAFTLQPLRGKQWRNWGCDCSQHRRASRTPMRKRESLLENNIEVSEIDDEAVRKGFSMQEAKLHNEKVLSVGKTRSPKEVLASLQRGNTRFWMGAATAHKQGSAFKRRALIMAQHPSVAILGCADSRVPIEIIFDQGMGDIFTIRVAGNLLDMSTLASLEYAACHLKVKVLMVLGHEGCGAVKSARLAKKQIEKEPKDLSGLLLSIKDGLEEERLSQIYDETAQDREAVVTNVVKQVEKLKKVPSIAKMIEQKEILVVGAFYEMSSGIVDFLE
eukprot:g3740.t1